MLTTINYYRRVTSTVSLVLLATMTLVLMVLTGGVAAAEEHPGDSGDLVWTAEPGQSGPEPLTAAKPPWKACGTNTKDSKVIRTFKPNKKYTFTLYCGHSKGGYRHIAARHGDDFKRLAALTGDHWRDVADLGMKAGFSDPDASKPDKDYPKTRHCFSRTITMYNKSTGEKVKNQIIQTIVITSTGTIITAHPAKIQCPGPTS